MVVKKVHLLRTGTKWPICGLRANLVEADRLLTTDRSKVTCNVCLNSHWFESGIVGKPAFKYDNTPRVHLRDGHSKKPICWSTGKNLILTTATAEVTCGSCLKSRRCNSSKRKAQPIKDIKPTSEWDKYQELNLMIKPKSDCTCVNVEMGSYDNQIMLGYYPVMQDYMKVRREAGMSEVGICIDRCLVDEIVKLWEADIMTFGCCCGHGADVAMVNVRHADIGKLKELGYDIFSIEDTEKGLIPVMLTEINGD